MKVNRSMLMAACAACLMTGLAAERRMDYPDYMRWWPQLKGVMLGSSTEKEFRDLRDMGATLARYQMHGQWNWFTNSTDDVAAFNVWMDKHLDHLAEMLPWARKYGIKICVDQHTHIGGLTKEKYNSDMIFVEKKYEDALVASWEKIARRFKGNLDVIYGYDLFNEPINRENALVKRSWHDVFCRVIEAIRAIDPDTPIIVEPNCNASPRGFDIKNPYGLKGVDLLPYENLIYTVHVYTPMGYTHLFAGGLQRQVVAGRAADAAGSRRRPPGEARARPRRPVGVSGRHARRRDVREPQRRDQVRGPQADERRDARHRRQHREPPERGEVDVAVRPEGGEGARRQGTGQGVRRDDRGRVRPARAPSLRHRPLTAFPCRPGSRTPESGADAW